MRRILFILLLRSFLPLAALRPAEPYFGDSLLYALSPCGCAKPSA